MFTIHNMEFGAVKLGEAAYYSQRFTTVSPTYAFEVRLANEGRRIAQPLCYADAVGGAWGRSALGVCS